MRLLMVAPPGAGKGTQARRLAARYHLVHIASGELLRHEVERGTPLGAQAAQYLARGDLVPDELVAGMIRDAVLDAVRRGGYVLDGFPRTVRQAELAYELSDVCPDTALQVVIHLVVRRDELRRRMLARALAEGRTDDTATTIEHRLEVYDAQTEPLLAYYASRRLLVEVDGMQPIDEVFADIVASVDRFNTAGAPVR